MGLKGDAVPEQRRLPVQQECQDGVREGHLVAAVEAVGEMPADRAAVGGESPQRGEREDGRVVESGRLGAPQHRQEFVTGVGVAAFVGEQDTPGEPGLAAQDTFEEALPGRAVEQRGGGDRTPVEQAQGRGGERQFEMGLRMAGECDGAHGQGRDDVERGSSGEERVRGQTGRVEGVAEGPGGGERVDGEQDVAHVVACGQSEFRRRGPEVVRA